MAKLFAVIAREYSERVRSRWFLIATIFGPLVFGALLIIPPLLAVRTKPSEDVSNIVILDATTSGLGERVAGSFPHSALQARPRVWVVAPDTLSRAESTATRAVVGNDARGYLVVDRSTLDGDSARYAGRNASSLGDMELITALVRRAVLATRLQELRVDSAAAFRISQLRPSLAAERLSEHGRAGSGLISALTGFGLAFLLYMSIILYGQTVLRGVLEEKNTRVAEMVVSSVPPNTLLAGKVIGVGGVGLTQQVIWLATGVLMAKLRAPVLQALGAKPEALALPSVSVGTAVTLALFFVLGYAFYSSLFAAVGAMVSNEQDAQQASLPVVLLLITPMIFLQTILLNPASRTAELLSWLPFSAPIIMPLRMIVATVSWWEVGAVIAGTLVACGAAIWIAARIYRVGLLMYGKRPSLKEVARWVRAAN
jgi:ABC-2 type transport system permease protein